MENVQKHLQLLGMRVEDRVTGFRGVVSSIGFDLYGCVQAIVNPGMCADGKLGESQWFDIARLQLIAIDPVMDRPNWDFGLMAEGKKGAADKPRFSKP